MNIHKQHIVLSLIAAGRYELDPLTGDVYSRCGKERRLLQPIIQYTDYKQYSLDIGFNETINVYGQGFSYLSTYRQTYNPKYVIDHIDKNRGNNHPDNLQCITEKENLQGDWRSGKRPFKRKIRLPIDLRLKLIQDHENGLSFCKIADKYHISRQTASKICNN